MVVDVGDVTLPDPVSVTVSVDISEETDDCWARRRAFS
jgi:hypothetical protein